MVFYWSFYGSDLVTFLVIVQWILVFPLLFTPRVDVLYRIKNHSVMYSDIVIH